MKNTQAQTIDWNKTSTYCAGRITNYAQGSVNYRSLYDNDGNLAGVLTYDEASGKANIIVHENKRRQGYGTRLFNELLRTWDFNSAVQDWTVEGVALNEARLERERRRIEVTQ